MVGDLGCAQGRGNCWNRGWSRGRRAHVPFWGLCNLPASQGLQEVAGSSSPRGDEGTDGEALPTPRRGSPAHSPPVSPLMANSPEAHKAFTPAPSQDRGSPDPDPGPAMWGRPSCPTSFANLSGGGCHPGNGNRGQQAPRGGVRRVPRDCTTGVKPACVSGTERTPSPPGSPCPLCPGKFAQNCLHGLGCWSRVCVGRPSCSRISGRDRQYLSP